MSHICLYAFAYFIFGISYALAAEAQQNFCLFKTNAGETGYSSIAVGVQLFDNGLPGWSCVSTGTKDPTAAELACQILADENSGIKTCRDISHSLLEQYPNTRIICVAESEQCPYEKDERLCFVMAHGSSPTVALAPPRLGRREGNSFEHLPGDNFRNSLGEWSCREVATSVYHPLDPETGLGGYREALSHELRCVLNGSIINAKTCPVQPFKTTTGDATGSVICQPVRSICPHVAE